MASTEAVKASRLVSSMVRRIFSISACITMERISWSPIRSLDTSIRWILVSLLRIIS